MTRFARRPVQGILCAAFAITATVLVGLASPAHAYSTGWTSLSSGGFHTCGIRGGRIYCWGADGSGQLGDGTVGGIRAIPAPIVSRTTDWTSVSAGGNHTCAIRAGRIYCWGYDHYGQLGDGAPGDGTAANDHDPTPGPIASSAADWTSVSAGLYYTCATRIGRIYCWGNDAHGQLGDGTAGDTPDGSPSLIKSTATDWTSVSSGDAHTCATRAGMIACWGWDDNGQLGDGTPGGNRSYPVLIRSRGADWKSVSAGDTHTCAVQAGRIYCWGNDTWGQLGDGTAGGNRAYPALIKSGATDWKSVSSGGNHGCGIRVSRVACWGWDGNGQLGDGTAGSLRAYPAVIRSGATDWVSVRAGFNHTCAIRATVLACWGDDANGQLGDGTPGTTPDPVPTLV